MKGKMIRSILFVLCFMCLISINPIKGDAKEAKGSKSIKLTNLQIDTLTIDVEDCNVRILETKGKKLYCKYDTKLYTISMDLDKDAVTVKISGISEKCKRNILDLYIPKKLKSDEARISSQAAGVNIDLTLDADLYLNSENGSMSYSEPKDFTHKITYIATDSSGSLEFMEGDYDEISIIKENSAISSPEAWSDKMNDIIVSKKNGKSNKKSNANKDTRILLNIADCSLSLDTK